MEDVMEFTDMVASKSEAYWVERTNREECSCLMMEYTKNGKVGKEHEYFYHMYEWLSSTYTLGPRAGDDGVADLDLTVETNFETSI
jgi:hypothetical protein